MSSNTEAVETVTETWLRSFQTGLALGLTGKPLPIKKEPVAYLYNGVRLPKLPEWDKEAHPCACIYWQEYSDGTGRIAVLRLSDNPIDIYDDVGHTYRHGLHQTWWIGDDGAWHVHDTSTHSGTSNLGGFGHPIYFHMLWGNYDIYDEHGVLHIPASEPVPVYE